MNGGLIRFKTTQTQTEYPFIIIHYTLEEYFKTVHWKYNLPVSRITLNIIIHYTLEEYFKVVHTTYNCNSIKNHFKYYYSLHTRGNTSK